MSKQTIQEKLPEAALPPENGTSPAQAASETGGAGESNPWAGVIGSFKDEPYRSFMEAVMENIRERRRQIDREEGLLDEAEESRVSS